MAVNDGSSCRNCFIDFQVQQNFASVCACAHDPLILKTDQREIFKSEIAFTTHSRSTKDIIGGNSIRYISSIPVDVLSGPQFFADGNDLLLNSLSCGRFEEDLCWARGTLGTQTIRDALQKHLTHDCEGIVSI